MRLIDTPTIGLEANFFALMRERGKIVPGSRREAHNVFTTTGRNLLAKLIGWQTIAGGGDVPYTQRRVRWIGVGTGSQLEVPTVFALSQPHIITASNEYLVKVASPPEFPVGSTIRFTREFSSGEITTTPTPVSITEAGLFADVNPAAGAPTEDIPINPGVIDTTLDPQVASNPPVAYKAFEGLVKTIDFTLEIRWEFRF